MPITRPTTKTIISTTGWGIPITDAVNANTNGIAALQPTAWTNVTLINGWIELGSGRAPTGYRKVGDTVTVRLGIKSGTAGATAFTLPSGYRPAYTVDLIVRAGNALGWVNILTDGGALIYLGVGADTSVVAGTLIFTT